MNTPDIEVDNASKMLRHGGILVYPTDTIWGIGCLASDASAAQKIYEIKNRPPSRSMIILVNHVGMAMRYAETIPQAMLDFLSNASHPTTMILKAGKTCPVHLCSDSGEIAIRIVDDAFCSKLISKMDDALVSTSANISGAPSAALFTEIDERILNKVDYVVNWRQNEKARGVQSSIIKMESGKIIQIR